MIFLNDILKRILYKTTQKPNPLVNDIKKTVTWIRIRITGDLLDPDPWGKTRRKFAETEPAPESNIRKFVYKMCCTIFLPGCHRQQQRYPTRIPRVAPRVQDCRPGPAHTKDGTFRGILSGINSSGNVSFVVTFLQWGGLGPRIEPGTGGLEEGTLTTRPPHFHHKLTSRFTKEGKKR